VAQALEALRALLAHAKEDRASASRCRPRPAPSLRPPHARAGLNARELRQPKRRLRKRADLPLRAERNFLTRWKRDGRRDGELPSD